MRKWDGTCKAKIPDCYDPYYGERDLNKIGKIWLIMERRFSDDPYDNPIDTSSDDVSEQPIDDESTDGSWIPV